MIVIGTSESHLQQFIHALNQHFSLKDLGDLHYFIGLQINRHAIGLTLSQKSNIKDVSHCSNMTMSAPIFTPADPYTRLRKKVDFFVVLILYR